MTWIYLVFIIILAGFGLWGLVSRAKWLEEQSKNNKK
ncbi:Uncharacterised protein [Lederbergia lenta]|uniref:Uncharacterized protein n=1 Tax=Lederbergia lenta TaxID=1467 RepID=A0A2X4WQ67_LEDLE|nr:Uncharacterised protein [Lederbergia lenta]